MKFKCKVITRSSRNEIMGLDNLSKLNFYLRNKNEKDLPQLKIYLTAVPVDGRANRDLIKLLSEKLDVSKSKISIIRGEKSSEKIIEIDD
jgi:hypothetical protein